MDLATLPCQSYEALLFHTIKSVACLQVTVPGDVRDKLDSVLDELFSESTETVSQDHIFYRTRIHDFGQNGPWDPKDMGAPPPNKAPQGRVHIAGNSVLYTAQAIDTATAEVRPAVGSVLTVAKFSPKAGEEIRVFNLTQHGRLLVDNNPAASVKRINRRFDAMQFSEREFSKQVHPHDPGKYLDTIYIAQVIRERGFDGIAYRSLLHKGGVNYAFFSPDRLECKTPTTMRKITAVRIKSEPHSV